MDPIKFRAAHGPEWHIQERFKDFLSGRGWLVERVIGNAFQKGLPDLFLGHPQHGWRWVDIKVFGKYSFTKPQRQKWPIWEQYGIGIWILGAASEEECTVQHMATEYNKLFEPPNWRQFWKSSWDEKDDIDKMLDELNNKDSK